MTLAARRWWVSLVLLLAAPAACVQPNRNCVPAATGGGCPGSIDGPAATDGPAGEQGAPDAAAGDLGAGDVAVDLAVDVGLGPEVGPLPAEPCLPDSRGCAGRAQLACGGDGRWSFVGACEGENVCSAGVCVCAAATCDQKLFKHPPGGVVRMVGAADEAGLPHRDAIYLLTDYGARLVRLDIQTLLSRNFEFEPQFRASSGFAPDANGDLYWCRLPAMGQERGDLLKEAAVITPGLVCSDLRLSARHVYTYDDVTGLTRFGLDGRGAERLTTGYLGAFELGPNHLYLVIPAGEGGYRLVRRPLEAISRQENVTDLYGQLTPRRLAVDEPHLYVAHDDRLMRVPAAGGPAEVFWAGEGPEVQVPLVTETHVYWSATTPGVEDTCTATRVWRAAKDRTTPPEAIMFLESYCGLDLVMVEDYLYAAVALGRDGPSHIRRLRR